MGGQKDLAYGSTLIAEIGRIKVDLERLQVESERRQDVRAALRAIQQRLAVVEFEGQAQRPDRDRNEGDSKPAGHNPR